MNIEPYEIAVDLPRRTLIMTFRGVWDDEMFDRFAREYARALTLLRKHGGCRHALVDGRDFAVQKPEISQRFSELIESLAPIASERSATIVPAQFNHLQAAPADTINARIFTDRAMAEAWLFSDRPANVDLI